MAKSTKHIDALGSYDTFKAPWQTEGGEDAEIDKAKLSRLIYNLKKDFALARDAHEDTKTTLTEVETERDEAKTAAADTNGVEAQKTIDKLTKERDAAQAKVDKFESDKAVAELRAEVLGDFAEKFPKAAKYVKGETKEELETSLEEVKEDWGIEDGEPGEGDENEGEEEPVVRNRPRSLLNPADKANGKPGEKEIDYNAVANEALGFGVSY